MSLALIVAKIFDLIFLVLIVSVLLTWIPNIKWQNEPFSSLKAFSEIFFALFRKIIPPIGMVDISPIFAFIALQIVASLLVRLLASLGL